MNLMELIKQRAAKMEELEKLVGEMGEEPTDEQTKAFDDLKKEIEGLDTKIDRLKSVEGLRAKQAQPVGTTSPVVAPAVKDAEEAKGNVARIARALAANKGIHGLAAQFSAKVYGENHDVTKALAASTGASGGFLVPSQFIPDMIELLRARAVVRSFGPTVMQLTSGTAEVPKLVGGATATWIGENQNIGKSEQTFGQVKLSAKKLAALVPISNDLLRYNAVGTEQIVRNDMIATMALAEDSAFLRGLGTAYSPKGLRYWASASHIFAANGTINLQNVKNDLGSMQLKLENSNARMINCGWVMSPRTRMYLLNLVDSNGNAAFPEVANGTLRGYPYKVTTQVPSNLGGSSDESELYFVDFADVVVGDAMTLMIDASDNATYHDGTQLQSTFSLDQTVVRVIAEVDLGVRHEESLAILTGVKWTP